MLAKQRSYSASLSQLAQIDLDLTTMIPPRRELPFNRASASLSSHHGSPTREGSTSRPSSSLSGLPPLPQPSFTCAETKTAEPQRPASAALKVIKKAVPTKRPVTAQEKTISTSPASKKRLNSATLARRASVAIAKTSVNFESSASYQSIGHGASPSQPVGSVHADCRSNSDVLQVNLGSKNVTADNNIINISPGTSIIEDPSLTLEPESDPLPTNLVRSLDRIGAVFQASPTTLSGSDKENLANYTALSAKDRMSVTEDTIVKLVGDENFITLCQDVFACWQRIGLEP
jgi:hypothetical protein